MKNGEKKFLIKIVFIGFRIRFAPAIRITTEPVTRGKLMRSMFVERKVHYSALFINLVGWHAGAVSFPQSDVILAQLA